MWKNRDRAILLAAVFVLAVTSVADAQPQVPGQPQSMPLPTPADLEIGTFIQVEGLIDGENTIVADQIEVYGDPLDEETLEADITAIDEMEMTFTVLGTDVMVDDETKLRADPDRTPIEFFDLAVGDKVKAKGTIAEGMMFARKVSLRVPEEDPVKAAEIQLEATIEEVNIEEGTVVVLGWTVKFGEGTKFKVGK